MVQCVAYSGNVDKGAYSKFSYRLLHVGRLLLLKKLREGERGREKKKGREGERGREKKKGREGGREGGEGGREGREGGREGRDGREGGSKLTAVYSSRPYIVIEEV